MSTKDLVSAKAAAMDLEERKWRAVEQLADVFFVLAEERHAAKGHSGELQDCMDAVCTKAHEAYYAL